MKGLEAKPCVDILLETDTRHPQKLIETLTRDGWILMSRKQEEQGDILCFNKATRPLDLRRRYIICMYAILQHGESFISVSICVPMMRCVANMQP